MDNIRIENLRCFKDTKQIALKPLTIAVGKNSSGKSTLLRVFPLFKQTIETKLSEPILWYGRYVDFGEYHESKSKYSSDDETINFEFEFTTDMNCLYGDRYLDFALSEKPKNKTKNTQVNIKIYVAENSIKEVDIIILGNTVELFYDKNNAQVIINNINLGKLDIEQNSSIDNIIPKLKPNSISDLFSLLVGGEKELKLMKKSDKLINIITTLLNEYNIKEKQYVYVSRIYSNLMKDFLDFEQNFKSIKQILTNTEKSSDMFILPHLLKDPDIPRLTNATASNFIKSLEKNKSEISNYILLNKLPRIIEECNLYLKNYFTNVRYIAPVRATAQRYYRKQGLDIQEVDSRGENVSVILQGMKEDEEKKFNNWLYSNFGFKIYPQSSEGHISLYIENETIKTNIADTGFGYSQILPIILMLWKNNYDKNRSETQIVIEQPELHLHPKMQIQLLELILKIISKDSKTKFFIETHSEVIINYIGAKIESKQVDNEDIEVLLIEQAETNESKIRKVKYTTDGYLEDWPIDFFQED